MEAMALMSETLGTLWRREEPEQQRVAAKRAKEEFFEPFMVMWPESVEAQDMISDHKMNLMDVVSEHFHIQESEYQAIVRMPASVFARIGKALSTIDEDFAAVIIISMTNEGVRFSTQCNFGSANIFCRTNTAVDEREEVTIFKMVNPVSLAFALKQLTAFTKATPLAAQVTISMSENIPIAVEYRMDNMGHIRFYLAPRIEEEEVTGAQVENVAEVEEGSEGMVEKIETDEGNEPNGENKPEPEIKLKEEIETDETKPQVEAKGEVEVMDAETDETKPQVEAKEEVEVLDAE